MSITPAVSPTTTSVRSGSSFRGNLHDEGSPVSDHGAPPDRPSVGEENGSALVRPSSVAGTSGSQSQQRRRRFVGVFHAPGLNGDESYRLLADSFGLEALSAAAE